MGMCCKYKNQYGKCQARKETPICNYDDCGDCPRFREKPKVTNADRIRSMTDEELADFIDELKNCGCSRCVKNGNNCFPCVLDNTLEWLKKETEGGKEDNGQGTA